MPKRTRDHHAWLVNELKDPATASNYLNEALADSPQMFLKALRNVGEASVLSAVARKAGFRRETLYKSLSKHGNPRLKTLDAVLQALGLSFKVKPQKATESGPGLQAQSATRPRTSAPSHHRRSRMVNPDQLALNFAASLASNSTAEAIQGSTCDYGVEQPIVVSASIRSNPASTVFLPIMGAVREPFAQVSNSPFDKVNLALLAQSLSTEQRTRF